MSPVVTDRPGDRPLMILACGLGTGYMRPASGTWASALAVVLYLPISDLNRSSLWWWWGLLLMGSLLLGVWASAAGERVTGEKDSHDIVIDEIVGQWIALSFLPTTAAGGVASLWGSSPQHIAVLVASFLLFRLFDIWKPGPVRRLQRWPGGWGVMIDDVLAGLCACLALHGALVML